MDGGFQLARALSKPRPKRAATRNESLRKSLRFIDLFAGLGGFHVGMSRQGHQCVFAAELDPELRHLYEHNFHIAPAGDIRAVAATDIPKHDVLCAGFPCQPFSLAGKQAGSTCPESGKLIDDVFRIISHHRPAFVVLENVPNILSIAGGSFWRHIESGFEKLGYTLDYRVFSPHQFGFPQKRSRIFVVAVHKESEAFSWPEARATRHYGIDSVVKKEYSDVRPLEDAKLVILNHWNEFIPRIKHLTSHTILAEEFGATYPINGFKRKTRAEWSRYCGAFGAPLADCKTWAQVLEKLPSYVCKETGAAVAWLRRSPAYSRELYVEDTHFIDRWKKFLIGAHSSWQKFEWRGYANKRDIWQHTIQFRASGIRAMRCDFAPSLVAMTPTQTPIFGPQKRYLAVREAAALQHLEGLDRLPATTGRAYKALGNAVNAFIVEEIAKRLGK